MSRETLGGRVVATLEARHAAELADLVTRHGGIPYPAPCLREVHDPNAAETQRAVQLICDDGVHAVVFLTGVGVHTIAEGARHAGREVDFLAGLTRKLVAVRGPKTTNAVRHLGRAPDLVATEPFTSDVLLQAIRREWALDGKSVLVQLYGAPVPLFRKGLEMLGARVQEVSPYRWERPLDEQAVLRLIEDLIAGWIDVLAATNAAQVDHLFAIARDFGHERDLYAALARPGLHIAAQGNVCASAFVRKGVEVDCIPARASMGAMVMELARTLAPPAPAAPPARTPTAEVFALYFGPGVSRTDICHVIDDLPADASVALLAGQRRFAEQYAVDNSHAVRILDDLDALIRRADRVVLVSTGSGVGAALQLAQRYAKPAGIISASSSASSSRDVRS